ncbi:MAG TPA: Cof-type HAD-IIB family hydrolase [Candidatus Olsenella excrementavium]|uniref:Cof-type HAD-IIB family hydrolase n=1 Tax=Candidatus Olsenella excrementavium TaxID=2838709 RepID=A0A9D1Z9U9_9ACTN|nr:Cof-type HAD-IIB family hydrolase [Candidatus Olsenella excrementavium]
MIKLFASDLDGTLFNILHETDGGILRRLRRTIEAGRHVALASGRCVRRTAELGFGDLPIESVGANGAHVVGRGGEVLRHVTIDPAVIEELLTGFPAVCFNCVGRDHTYVRGTREQHASGYLMPRGLAGVILRYRMSRAVRTDEERFDCGNADVLAQDICKLNFRVPDPGMRREMEAFVAERSDVLVNASFDGDLFELTDARVNKGEAVAWLAGELGLSEDEVAVYGDGGNDLAMLERFDHAYATSNGSDAAKRAAGSVIGSCALHAVPRHIVRTVRREGPLR